MGRAPEHLLGVKGVFIDVAGPVLVGDHVNGLGLCGAGQESERIPGRPASLAGQLS